VELYHTGCIHYTMVRLVGDSTLMVVVSTWVAVGNVTLMVVDLTWLDGGNMSLMVVISA